VRRGSGDNPSLANETGRSTFFTLPSPMRPPLGAATPLSPAVNRA
jgi:hypothetical protein